MKLYGIVGAGGFGREVMALAQALLLSSLPESTYQLVFIELKQDRKWINNCLVMTSEAFLAHPATDKYFNIAITDYRIRKRIAEEMISHRVKPFRIDALNRVELVNNEIGEGGIFCPYSTVSSNVKIGKFFHANFYSYIAHDCIIGDYVTFAPNVLCNGSVIIEDYAYIGAGVIIKQGMPNKPIIIGKGAVLGMGAVVTKSVPAYQTVIGNPARPMESSTTIKAVLT